MPRYLLSVYGPAERDEFGGDPTAGEVLLTLRDTRAFTEKLAAEGYLVFAGGLAQATTATVVDGQGVEPVFTDGPYRESDEYIGGFWVVGAADLDVALRLAVEGSKACRGRVEVRPFQTGGLFGS